MHVSLPVRTKKKKEDRGEELLTEPTAPAQGNTCYNPTPRAPRSARHTAPPHDAFRQRTHWDLAVVVQQASVSLMVVVSWSEEAEVVLTRSGEECL